MPYESVQEDKDKNKTNQRRGFKHRMRQFFFSQFHLLANLSRGFGLTKMAGGIYKWLINMGDDKAMFKLGEMYWWGYKYVRDPVKAVQLIEYASIKGNPDAIAFKEEMIQDGLWKQGKSRDEFMTLFDAHVGKESRQGHSLHIIMVLFYTLMLGVVILLMHCGFSIRCMLKTLGLS